MGCSGDVPGRAVPTLVQGKQSSGLCAVAWDGTDRMGQHGPPGLYVRSPLPITSASSTYSLGMMLRTPFLFLAFLLVPAASAQVASVTVTTITPAFNASGGVAVGPDGLIYVADFGATLSANGGNTLYRLQVDGTREVFATGFQGASGNAFDVQGNLYQSNIGGGFVSRVTPEGTVTTYASTGIVGPVGAAVDAAGNVYNTNCQTPGRISKTTPARVTTTLVQSSLLNCPNGLTLDDAGNLYTANFSDGRIVKITPGGTPSVLVTLPAGSGFAGPGNGHLTFANGRLYVCNWTGRIYEVTLDGQARVLAGTGALGTQDGPGDQATFYRPNGISATVTGDTLFINQSTQVVGGSQLHPNVVRMITGVLSTIVSTEEQPEQPHGFGLLPNAPNPFSDSTEFHYTLHEPGWVTLTIFDLQGRQVATLVESRIQASGAQRIGWAGAALAPGTYLARLQLTTDGGAVHQQTRPIVRMR